MSGLRVAPGREAAADDAPDVPRNASYDEVVVLLDVAPGQSGETVIQPTLGAMSREIRRALERAERQGYRRILMYFSGHAFRDDDKRLFLLPPDYDPKNVARTSLSLQELQLLLQSTKSVPIRLLVLDCCHSGAGKGPSPGFGQDEIDLVFESAAGTLTVASCQTIEESSEWDAKQQGVFTYWLCEVLAGAADRDENRLPIAPTTRAAARLAVQDDFDREADARGLPLGSLRAWRPRS